MIVEGLRLVAAWLGHETHGVAAQLATMTFDGSDSAPAAPTIVEETTNDLAAMGRAAEASPNGAGGVLGVVALPLEDASGAVTTPGRDLTLRLMVQYANASPNLADARRDGYYTLRAVLLSLRALTLEATPAERTRGSIALVSLDELRLEPAPAELALMDGSIYGQVVCSWQVTDLST